MPETNWWENDPLLTSTQQPQKQADIQPDPNVNWWESDPVSQADSLQSILDANKKADELQRIRKQQEALKLAADSELQNASYPTLTTVANTVANRLAAPLARIPGVSNLVGNDADTLYRDAAALEQSQAEMDTSRYESGQNISPPWLNRGARGVATTLPVTVAAGLTGGPLAAIGSAAAQEVDQSITEGRESGLEGTDLAAYAATHGVVEGATEAVLQKIGLGGAEKLFQAPVKSAINNGVRNAVKSAIGRTVEELPGEIATEIGHNVVNKMYGTDPNALSAESLQNTVFDTTVQTLMTMGLMESANIAGNAAFRKLGGKRRFEVTGQEQEPAPQQSQFTQPQTEPEIQSLQVEEPLQVESPETSVEVLRGAETTKTPQLPAVMGQEPPLESGKQELGDTVSRDKPYVVPMPDGGFITKQPESVIPGADTGDNLEKAPEVLPPDSTPQAAQESVTQQAESPEPTLPAEPAVVKTKKKLGGKKVEPLPPKPYEFGGKLGEGETVFTSSGRTSTPFPKIDMSTSRKADSTSARVEQWLIDNAIEEAKSRGDDFNLRQFVDDKRIFQNSGSIPQASKDGMELYLFGEQPKVVPSILKPLRPSAPPTQQPAQQPTVQEPVNTEDQQTQELPTQQAGNVPVDPPKPETEGFASLPKASKKLFDDAWNSKDSGALTQYLQPSNKNFRAEFESRSGVKLPKTYKGTKQVVEEYFAPQPGKEVIPSETQQEKRNEEGGKGLLDQPLTPQTPEAPTTSEVPSSPVEQTAGVVSQPDVPETSFGNMAGETLSPDLQLQASSEKASKKRLGEVLSKGIVVGDRVVYKNNPETSGIVESIDDRGIVKIRYENGDSISGTDLTDWRKSPESHKPSVVSTRGQTAIPGLEDAAADAEARDESARVYEKEHGKNLSDIGGSEFAELHRDVLTNAIPKAISEVSEKELRNLDIHDIVEKVVRKSNLPELPYETPSERSVEASRDEYIYKHVHKIIYGKIQEADAAASTSKESLPTESPAPEIKVGDSVSGKAPFADVKGVVSAIKGGRVWVKREGGITTGIPIADVEIVSNSDVRDTVSPDIEEPKKRLGDKDSIDRVELGNMFAKSLQIKQFSNINDVRREAESLTGKKIAPGTSDAKNVDEAFEQAIVHTARGIATQKDVSDEAKFDQLKSLYESQPILGVRTSTSMAEQAYSTPAPLAWLANVIANVGENDTVYDSSAGNGMLLLGANKRFANELNPDRVASLKNQGIETTQGDATTLRAGKKPDVVIINPPFGKVGDGSGGNVTWNIDGFKTDNVDHAIVVNTLKDLPENGRAVLIIGSKGFEKRKPKENRKRANAYSESKSFYDHVWNNYNVVDHFTVHGDLYSRQGASFPVDVIVINGRGESAKPKPYNFLNGGLPQVFESWEGLKDAKLRRMEIRRSGDGMESEPGVPSSSDSTVGNDVDMGDVSKPTTPKAKLGTKTNGTGGGGSRRTTGRRMGSKSRGSDNTQEQGAGVPSGERDVSQQDTGNIGSEPGVVSDGGATPGRVDGSDRVNVERVAPDARPDNKQRSPVRPPKESAETESQSRYTPTSKASPLDTLVPRSQAGAVARSLERIEEEYGNLDEFVAREVGMTVSELHGSGGTGLAAEQIDAVAMMIANHKEGRSTIIGDQTGIGKGRSAAMMIRYAIRNGMVPVFVTEKPSLFADMVRDLTDIGMNTPEKPFNILATNTLKEEKNASTVVELPDGRRLEQSDSVAKRKLTEAINSFLSTGKLVAKEDRKNTVTYDAIFTTYTQLQPVAGKYVARHEQLDSIAHKSFFIFDESHNAGGSGEDSGSRKKKDEDESASRAKKARELIDKSAGHVFLSATFAKKPKVMDLYKNTGIGDAVEDIETLPDVISSGGVPMQQVISEMLSEYGGYIRRERSYDGVEFAPKVVEIDLKQIDTVSGIFRDINEFDKIKEEVIESGVLDELVSSGGERLTDDSVGEGGITSTSFSSILWNLVDQMLLSAKASSAADEAIEAWKNGESPVITTDNTMESSLKHYLDEFPTNIGDEVKFTYTSMLKRYLDRSREIIIKKDKDDKEPTRIRLTDEQLGEAGVEKYKEILAKINSITLNLPASPIDAIRNRLENAGMKVTEVTGRKLMIKYANDGKMYLAERPQSEAGDFGKINSIKKFNSGEQDAIILNQSGATGVSLHASQMFKNQRPRRMIIAQANKNIDTLMQMLGRIHRTGQVELPAFSMLMTNAPAENRPAAVTVKKLASLNANVTADAKGSVNFDIPDILNSVGNRIVAEYIADEDELNQALGNPVEIKADGSPKITASTAQKVTGKMALMPVSVQEQFWDHITNAFKAEIEELNRTNKNPLVAQTIDMKAKQLASMTIFEGDKDSASPFKRPAVLEKVLAKRDGEPMKSSEVKAKISEFYSKEFPTKIDMNTWAAPYIEQIGQYVNTKVRELQDQLENLPYPDKSTPENMEKYEKAKSVIKRRIEKTGDMERTAVGRIKSYAPGHLVRIEEVAQDGHVTDTVYGVIINAKRKGKSKNALAMSQWAIDIAVPTPDRVVSTSLSRVGMVGEKVSSADDGEQSDSQRRIYSIGMQPRQDDYDSFDVPLEAYETRYIATGNLIAANEKLLNKNGKITFFTDSTGSVKRGILMPRSFDAAEWQKNMPVTFRKAKHVLDFLSGDDYRMAATPDKNLWVTMDKNGALIVAANKSKQRSGRYTLNKNILNASSPSEFVSVGNRMEMRITTKSKQMQVMDAILEESPLETESAKDEARSIVGNDDSNAFKPTPDKSRDTVSPDSSDDKMSGTKRSTMLGSAVAKKPDDNKPGMSALDLAKTWSRMFGVPVMAGGFNLKGASGIYKGAAQYMKKKTPELIRLAEESLADLPVLSHEIAHHIDKKTGITEMLLKTPQLANAKTEIAGLDYEPKGRVHEGFAEYVRMYITDTVTDEQNGSYPVAPEFSKYFHGQWAKANQEFYKKINEAKSQFASFADQSIIQTMRATIGNPGDDLEWSERFKKETKSLYNWIRTGINEAVVLKDIQQEAEKRGFQKQKKAGVYDTYIAYKGASDAYVSQALEKGVHAITDDRKLGDNLWDVPQREIRNEEENDESIIFAWARHTVYVHDNINSRYNTGMPYDWAKKVLQEIRDRKDKTTYQRYERVAINIAKYANALRDMQVDAGDLSQEDRDRMVKPYGDYYFPLERVQDGDTVSRTINTSKFANLGAPARSRSMRGSDRPPMNPYDQLIKRTQEAYSRAANTRVMFSLLETLVPKYGGVAGMGGVLDVIDPKTIAQSGEVREILQSLVDAGFVDKEDANAAITANKILNDVMLTSKEMVEFENRHGLVPGSYAIGDPDWIDAAMKEPDILSRVSFWRPDFTPNAAKATFLMHDQDGKRILAQADRMLYNIATGYDKDNLSVFLSNIKRFTRPFRTGAIALSTGFAAANLPRDFIEYQGKASAAKGTESVTMPLEVLSRYVYYKYNQIAGKPTNDKFIESYESWGGKLFTRIGNEEGSRIRMRKRKLGETGGSSTIERGLHLKDMALSALESLEEYIAISDAPPRIAEFEKTINALGYSSRGDKWIDTATGKITDLPEHVKIKALVAAANATTNFKVQGLWTKVIDAFLPLTNATVQASYRDVMTLGSVAKTIAGTGTKEDSDKAARFLVYSAAMATIGLIFWAMRKDDEDYKEQDDYEKEGYWSFGSGNRTYFRIPKPRDIGGLVANFTEAFLNQAYNGTENKGEAIKSIKNHMYDRIPVGGGPLRGVAEIWGDYDMFREQPLTPRYLSGQIKEKQFTAKTLPLSVAIGQLTSKIGLSPIQFEHLISQSTGGMYYRVGDAMRAAKSGDLQPKHIPFVRAFVINDLQKKSITDFYEEMHDLDIQVKRAEYQGKPDKSAKTKLSKLKEYSEMMQKIRELDKEGSDGLRSMKYEHYIVGLAREALGRDPLDISVSPFKDEKLPQDVHDALYEHVMSKVESVSLSKGSPERSPRETKEEFSERYERWRENRDADEAWLKNNKDAKIVNEAIESMRTDKRYFDLISGRGEPNFDPKKESFESHLEDTKRWLERVSNAEGFLGEYISPRVRLTRQ